MGQNRLIGENTYLISEDLDNFRVGSLSVE